MVGACATAQKIAKRDADNHSDDAPEKSKQKNSEYGCMKHLIL